MTPDPIQLDPNSLTWHEELTQLINTLAVARNTSLAMVRGRRRRADIVKARKSIAKAVEPYGYSLTQIGRAMNRDHSTIHFYLNT